MIYLEVGVWYSYDLSFWNMGFYEEYFCECLLVYFGCLEIGVYI